MRPPKVTLDPVEPYEPAEIDALLEACGRTGFTAGRDRAIITTLAQTGVRLSECAAIEVDHHDKVQGVIVIPKGKGNKHRVVPAVSMSDRHFPTRFSPVARVPPD